jgi:hypothetical protein
MNTVKSSAGFAVTAALLAIAAASSVPAAAAGTGKLVHCYGVNSCKGTSDCKTAHNDCKGLNGCKGQGFKEMSAKQCAAEGGSLTEVK